MRYACRCQNSKCRARHSLPRHPDDYVRPRVCRNCGSALRLDGYRQGQRCKPPRERTDPAPVCQCDGAHYPHRRGWVRLCKHFEERVLETAVRGRGQWKDPADMDQIWLALGVPA